MAECHSPLQRAEEYGLPKAEDQQQKQDKQQGNAKQQKQQEQREKTGRKINEAQKAVEDLKKEAEKQSMVTMRQDGILKVLKGVTSVSEVITSTQAKTF